MSWKDFLYFQKGDRIAILVLLSLIVISGCLFIVFKPVSKIDSNSNLEKEFFEFQANLIDIDSTNTLQTNENLSVNDIKDNYRYSLPRKLKTGETIEINKSDTSDLKKIPGIGSSYANRIVKYRNLLGGYVTINQLKEVWGIDNELYNKISPYITIVPQVEKIKLNTVSFKELLRHPYIDYDQAKIIIDIRERKGEIKSIRRLKLLDEFSEKDIIRLTPYLDFN